MQHSNLSEKAGVVVFARIITTIIDLAIVIATIQLLSKTDFAIIGYLLMIHEVARNMATLGFPESVFFFFERVSGGAKRAFVIQTTFILARSEEHTYELQSRGHLVRRLLLRK